MPTTQLIAGLSIMTVGIGLAILLESDVLLGVVVILPFLAGMWVIRNEYLHLTRQCVNNYLQRSK